jgi:hypothetical protein
MSAADLSRNLNSSLFTAPTGYHGYKAVGLAEPQPYRTHTIIRCNRFPCMVARKQGNGIKPMP